MEEAVLRKESEKKKWPEIYAHQLRVMSQILKVEVFKMGEVKNRVKFSQ